MHAQGYLIAFRSAYLNCGAVQTQQSMCQLMVPFWCTVRHCGVPRPIIWAHYSARTLGSPKFKLFARSCMHGSARNRRSAMYRLAFINVRGRVQNRCL
jgi:hypothetical protein